MASRSLNSSRNAFSGAIKVAIKIIFPFILRTVFLYYLGKEYLGLSSLFSSILSVLNLAELGFSSAVVFRLYKPFAENNEEIVGAYLNYLKKIYRVIGCIVFGVGLILTPFLLHFISGDYPENINIYALYLIYLFNTGISYFFSGYKRALFLAAQRLDLINVIETGAFCAQYVLQIVVLIIFRNYYLYAIAMPLCTVLINVFISRIASEKFPQYFNKTQLGFGDRKAMQSDIRGVAIYRISEVTRNSFDSIVISSVLGLVPVAIYNNYYYIFSSIYAFMVIINQSLQSSVGNSIVTETIDKNEKDLLKFSLFSLWIVSYCSISLLCLYQPFMTLWMGADMLLPTESMVLFCLYFYVLNMNNIRNLYFDGNGLWMKGAWSFVFESLTNLVLNIGLGLIWGINGVIIATIVTMFVFSFVWRSKILYQTYFKRKALQFIKLHCLMFFLCSANASICYFICSYVGNQGIVAIILRFLICLIVPNGVYYTLFRKHPYFREGARQVKQVIMNKRKQYNK